MSIVSKIRDLGYSVAEVHWLHAFYDIGAVVTDPFNPHKAVTEQAEKFNKLNALVDSGNKFFIDQAIKFGRSGITYEHALFMPDVP